MKLPHIAKQSTGAAAQATPSNKGLRRKLVWGGSIAAAVIVVGLAAGTWFSSGMLLKPSFEGLGKGYSTCDPETEKRFGKDCGNLRASKAYAFSEVTIPSRNGYTMPGWLIKAADNGKAPAQGVIMLAHAGGSDRREDTRHIAMYLNQGLDVLTFDQGCAGEAPCPVQGVTYGQRESRDVLSAYHYLTAQYDKVYAMGSSVGAAALLIALPEMPQLQGLIAENAYTSFERLVKEAPESQNVPGWATDSMIGLAKARGQFDGLASPEHVLPLAGTTVPVLFIHSKADTVISHRQTEDLVKLYKGPASTWYPDKGEHALVSNEQPAAYQQRIVAFLQASLER
ncbi:MAG TPA: hypothetical protein VD735_07460 [Candidatus Saccharimonadales bacterium]|nr:hypothetical protein [Candidatus Saccharimonadales bacterium]